jgi:transposase-like protein
MEKRHWTSQQKLTIVLEGLSGSIEISKLCAKYQIAQRVEQVNQLLILCYP